MLVSGSIERVFYVRNENDESVSPFEREVKNSMREKSTLRLRGQCDICK